MKIAIDIDLIRDWYSTLIAQYIKDIGDWDGNIFDVNPNELWKHFTFPKYNEEIIDVVKVKSEDEQGRDIEDEIMEIKLVIDESSPMENNQEYFNSFVKTYVMEIFGHAKEKETGVISHLNNLARAGHFITIFSKNGGKARAASLFFLSKYAAEINNVIFIKNSNELTGYDEILTVNNFTGKIKDLDFKID